MSDIVGGGMSDSTPLSDIDLRTRIAALIAYELVRQAETRNEYWYKYTPLDDAGNDLPQLIGLDTSIDPAAVADALIEALEVDVEDGECNYCQAQLPGCRYSTWMPDDE